MIDGAIEYVQANQGKPVRLSNVSLLEAGKKVAAAVKIGNWEGNEEPKYNADEDMALITCEFIAGRDQLTYTATFHRVGNEWKLRGVRETMQALLGMPPDRKTFVGVWHGYCESRLQFARLELNDDSRGFLALSELRDSTPFIYRVIEWKPRGSMVEIGLEPVGTDPEPIELKNVTHSIDGIELEVHGKGWWRKLTLFKEDEFQRRAEDVKKNLEKVRVVK